VNDPQVLHNNMISEMELNGEKYKTIGSIFKFPGEIEGTPEPPPDLGKHTEEILRNLLSYSDTQIKEISSENHAAFARLKKKMKKVF